MLAETASDATEENTWDIEWFRAAKEWVRLSEFDYVALVVFSDRGRRSGDKEEALSM